EAELAYRKAETRKREFIRAIEKQPERQPRAADLQDQWNAVDLLLVNQGRMKARQGRLSEAEADVRRGLLHRLARIGKNGNGSPRSINQLALILIEQGRYAEAVQLLHTSLEIQRTLGRAPDSQEIVFALSQLARVSNLQHHYNEVDRYLAELDAAIKSWDPK